MSLVGTSSWRSCSTTVCFRLEPMRGSAQSWREFQSSVRKTMPVRGLGQKNVVFWGMRTRSTAAARVCATVTGEHRIAASPRPCRRVPRRRARRGGSGTTRPGVGARPAPRRPRRRSRRRPGARRRARRRGPRRAGWRARGLRRRRARARARRACAPSSASTPSGVTGPASVTTKASARSARTSAPAGRSISRWIGSIVKLVVDELDDEAHDRGGTVVGESPRRGARRGRRTRSRTGGDRRRGRAANGRRRPRSRRCAPGRRSRRACGAYRRCRSQLQRNSAGSSRSVRPAPSERPQIGSTFTRIARSSDEPVRLRLGQRALVGEHVVVAGLGQPQRADDRRGCAGARRAAVGVLHPVRVEAGLVVDEQHPGGLPFGERRRGACVAVALLRLVARQDQAGPSCADGTPRALRARRRR